MDEREHAEIHLNQELQKLAVARELLTATRRNMQLLDEQVQVLQQGRRAVLPADDVPSEHRTGWLGAVDDDDHENGILVSISDISGVIPQINGFSKPGRGTIRNQEDAAFVVTRIFVAQQAVVAFNDAGDLINPGSIGFAEGFSSPNGFDDGTAGGSGEMTLAARFTDANTGRNLVSGITQDPEDKDRGIVDLEFLSSFRPGLGSNFKNALFSEFTVPRAGAVRVEIFNLRNFLTDPFDPADGVPNRRCFVTLYGFKVYGA